MNNVKYRLLSAAVILSLAASPLLPPLTAWAAEPAGETAWYSEKEHAGIDYSEMEYTGYDTEALDALLDTFSAAADTQDTPESEAEVISLYQQLLDETDKFYTQYTLLQIQYYTDVTDEELSSQLEALEIELNEYSDRIFLAIQAALNGPQGEALRGQMSASQIEMISEYDAMTERELALAAEEIRLVQQYDQAMMQEYTVTYGGKEWDEASLEEVSEEDADTYYAVLTLLLKQKNEVAGPIFQELVRVRTEIAQENGYANYSDYAYEELYNRDFSPEDIQGLYPVIKEKISPLHLQAQLLFYTMDSDAEALNTPVSGEEILDAVEPYIGQVDPALTEAFSYMREHHLYDIEDSDTKMSMAFTTGLYETGDAFIFAQPYGYYQDYWTVIHEFGHYNAMFHSRERGLYEQATLDVAEIHSQGLEVLFFDYMDDMFGEYGDVLKMSSLTNMLFAVVEGFKYDEFQQAVYADPDMTLDEINDLAARLESEYMGLGPDAYAGAEGELYRYYWIMINHTFQSPMYYISYATSALAALDIWGESLSDREAAADRYMALTAMGFSVPYQEALEKSGLRNLLDEETIKALSSEIYPEIRSLASEESEDSGKNASGGNEPENTGTDAAKTENPGTANGVSAAPYAAAAAVLIVCAAAWAVNVKRRRQRAADADAGGGQTEDFSAPDGESADDAPEAPDDDEAGR